MKRRTTLKLGLAPVAAGTAPLIDLEASQEAMFSKPEALADLLIAATGA